MLIHRRKSTPWFVLRSGRRSEHLLIHCALTFLHCDDLLSSMALYSATAPASTPTVIRTSGAAIPPTMTSQLIDCPPIRTVVQVPAVAPASWGKKAEPNWL